MFNKKQYLRFQSWIIFFLVLSGISILFRENRVEAQIIPDKTLVDESSVVTPINSVRDRIDGGAIRGSNLFHSFTEFNIGEGREAYFSNPEVIENIFSRVTGSNPSRIFGKLGVLGDANLFLLNPKGIIFGSNASLDINGSFFATTASSFDFGEGKNYSAINPTAPPLLSVNVKPPIGLEFEGVAGDIENRGNLVVGKDFTLQGNNLDLQGRLEAGENLTLKAEDTVKVRDSVEKAFIAASGDKLLIQGKESVDIFALNHSDSGLFAGGDMILSSTNPVNGDIHFWSGGNFGIEKLDKNKGDLFSFFDPIIRSQGDVSFFAYQGASLHILAGGKVDINTVVITEPDSTGKSINPITTPNEANVTLSDGTSLVIDGSKRATLDIRAGVDSAAIGNPLGTSGDGGTFFNNLIFRIDSPENNPVATSADITIGDIRINSPDGLVFLTNQYQPNSALSGGNINITDNGVFGDGIDVRGRRGNGSDVILDSRGDINLKLLDTSSHSGNGGDISLLANNSNQLQNSSIVSYSITGNGGDINIFANDSIELENSLISSFAFIEKSGDIKISTNDSIQLENTFIGASSLYGNGGNINIFANDSIQLKNNTTIDSSASLGNSGNINIFANNSIQSQFSSINSFSDFGKAGNVDIFAKNSMEMQRSLIDSATLNGKENAGDISIKTSDLKLKGSSVITASTSLNSSGNGGNINIDVDNLKIDEGSDIISASIGAGKGGDITVNATDLIEIVGFSRAGSSGISSQASGIDNAGNVNINTNKLIIRDGGGISVSTQSEGNAGNIDITAKSIEIYNREANNLPLGTFVLDRLVTSVPTGLSSQTNPGSTGNAGNITINTEKLRMSDSGEILTQTFGDGDGGEIDIKAKEIELIGTSRKFFPTNLSTGTASTLNGKAGNLTITTERLFVSDEAQISTGTVGSGKGANLTIDATEIVEVTNDALITGSSQGTNDAGNLIINAPIVKVINGGQILSVTTRAGEGGSLTINATERFELGGTSSEGIDSYLATETFGTGNAGQIKVIAPTLLIKDRGKIRADTSGNATGNGNDINIQGDTISLSNQANISAGTTSQGNAGNIIVTANIFEANNGSKLRTTTATDNKAGNITLNIKNNLTLTGGETGIFANTTENSTGNGGSIIIDPEVVNILDGAQISVNSSGEGIGGDIELTAGKLNLDNGKISAETRSNTGGDITLNIQDLLLLSNGSEITTTAGNEQFGGDGGNIKINTPDGFIVAFPNENSNISANAFQGDGGRIDISAFSILGIEFRDKPTSLSDITASSEFGSSGEVNIETPGIEPNPESEQLVEDAQTTEVAQGCQSSGENAIAFFNIGRGGLPPQPGDTLSADNMIANWIPLVLEESKEEEKVSRIRRGVEGKGGVDCGG